ncbi:MAG: IS30 family transposase [Verrucomicrobiota bacterium]
MEQNEGNTPDRKGKHLKRNERILIEGFLKAGMAESNIARQLGRDRRTIGREVERGQVEHLNSDLITTMVYNADRAQDVYDENATAKGPVVKLKANSAAVEFIRCHIVIRRWSPEAVAARMKQKGMDGAVCAKTIYNHIDKGEIPGVSNETLWEKRKRGMKHKTLRRQPKRGTPLGHGIDERPEKVEKREEFGHWEIDLVVGGQGKGSAALLTLTERKSRKEILCKLKDKTQKAVVRAINGIERQMGKEAFKVVFKSITADNGSEFLDYRAMERSVFGGYRTHIYYARPYSSWERGSNENANRIIRRFIPKGCDISKFTRKQIQKIENWINNYPRRILDFETAEERFIQELAA